MNYKKFLWKWKGILSLASIDRKCKFPAGTCSSIASGKIKISINHIKLMDKILEPMMYAFLEDEKPKKGGRK